MTTQRIGCDPGVIGLFRKGREGETSHDFLGIAEVRPGARIGCTDRGHRCATVRGRNRVCLATGLQGGSSSTIGPDRALHVTETAAGRITQVDPKTGATTTYASGLPKSIIGLGGAMDIAFIGRTAYVLVTLVGPDVAGSDSVSIYRVDGPYSFTVVADIGKFAIDNPPDTPFDVPNGLQYALEPYRGGFLVTDGHHNRVYRVTLDGEVTSFGPKSTTATEVASGSPLVVDVEFGRGHTPFPGASGPAALRVLPSCRTPVLW